MASSRQRFVQQMYLTAAALILALGLLFVAALWLFYGRTSGGREFTGAVALALVVYMVAGLLVSVFLVSWSVRSILRPLGNTIVVASRVAEGDLSVTISGTGSKTTDSLTESVGAMLRELRNPRRGWDTILVLDTARIARRRHLSIIFEEHECKRAGVKVIYKSLPESDPITEMLLKSILQAMDEWHSLTSKAKGLAGMAENVRQGFRAGGSAPKGYRLESIATGTIREGQPVTKSKLILGDD
uniref:HAMP domain-containing protein n=1 Tax=uncultured Arthrobacter sp. TaxID=114050 RepID=UPI0032174549